LRIRRRLIVGRLYDHRLISVERRPNTNGLVAASVGIAFLTSGPTIDSKYSRLVKGLNGDGYDFILMGPHRASVCSFPTVGAVEVTSIYAEKARKQEAP
jgi:hypothetical protein